VHPPPRALHCTQRRLLYELNSHDTSFCRRHQHSGGGGGGSPARARPPLGTLSTQEAAAAPTAAPGNGGRRSILGLDDERATPTPISPHALRALVQAQARVNALQEPRVTC
jgi:hypothetical protein